MKFFQKADPKRHPVFDVWAFCVSGIVLLTGIFLVPQTHAAGLSGTQWPKWGHDERNTSRQTNFFQQTGGFSLSWSLDMAQYDPGVSLQGSMILGGDGTLYAGGYTNAAPLYAIDQKGFLKWRVALGNGSQPGHAGAPAFHSDGNLIVASPYGTHKINPANGAIIWNFTQFRTYTSSPTIGSDGTIFVYGVNLANGAAMFFALNPGDGSLKWSRQLTGSFDGSPALANDGTIYFTTSDGKLWALNPTDGAIVWTYTLGEQPTSSPLVGIDGTIYVGCLANIFSVNPNGTLKWVYNAGTDYFGVGMAEAGDGTIFAGGIGAQSYVIALNPNGTLKWQQQVVSPVDGGLSVDGQGVIYAPANVAVYALNSDGTIRWQYNKPSEFDFSFFSTPVISVDNRLLLITGATDGTVTALIPEGLLSLKPSTQLSKPPQVMIESPRAGDAVGKNVTLKYTAEDADGGGNEFGLSDAPIWVDYSLNQGIAGTWKSYIAEGPNDGKAVFADTVFGDGTNVYFRIVVRDRTGLFDEAAVGPIRVDTVPPAFHVRAARPLEPGFIAISISSTEALKGAPDVYVDQAGRGKVLAVTRGEGAAYSAQYEVVQHFDGVAQMYVTGQDLAGNLGSVILSGDRFSVFVTPPPPPQVIEPQDGVVLADPAVDIVGTSAPSAAVILTVNGSQIYRTVPAADGTFRFLAIELTSVNKGVNILSFVAEDQAGVSEPVTRTVIINTLPQVVISSLRGSRALSDIVQVTWIAEDKNADALRYAFAYSRGGEAWVTLAENLTQPVYAWDTTQVSDGPGIRIRVTASDGRGASFTIAGPFTLQNFLPNAILTAPEGAGTAQPDATLFVNIGEAQSLAIEGSAVSERYTVAGFSWRAAGDSQWTAISARDGSYNTEREPFAFTAPVLRAQGRMVLQFRTEDSRGKFGYQTITFTFDATPPTAPQVRVGRDLATFADTDDADAETPGLHVRVEGAAEPFATVIIEAEGSREVARAEADRGGSWQAVVLLAAHGANALSAYAEDRAGNRSEKTGFTLISNNPPELAFLFPKPGDVLGARNELSWRAKDPDGDIVGGFSLAWRGQGRRSWSLITDAMAQYTYAWKEVTGLTNGAYEVRLTGSDGFVTREAVAPIRVDTIPPVVIFADTLPRRTNQAMMRAEGSATDDSSGIEAIEYAFGGEPFTKATLVRGYRGREASWRFSLPRGLADGDYTLAVRAVDRGENISAPITETFAVDTTPPGIGTWRIAAGPLQLIPGADGVVNLFAGTSYEFTFAVTADAEIVSVAIGENAVSLKKIPGGLFSGTARVETEGNFVLRAVVADDLGNTKESSIGALRAVEAARVVAHETGEPIAEAKVSAFQFDPDAQTWRLWDAAAWHHINPQITDTSGIFHFTLPTGTYELRVNADGYQRAKTQPFTVTDPMLLTLTLRLEPLGFFGRMFDAILP